MNYKGVTLPDGMIKEAEEYIKNVIDDMDSQSKLNVLDYASYYLLAQSYNTFLEASELQKTTGLLYESPSGVVSVHPSVRICRDQLTATLRIAQDLGCTIRARKSLKVLDNEGGNDETEFMKFMKLNNELLNQ